MDGVFMDGVFQLTSEICGFVFLYLQRETRELRFTYSLYRNFQYSRVFILNFLHCVPQERSWQMYMSPMCVQPPYSANISTSRKRE